MTDDVIKWVYNGVEFNIGDRVRVVRLPADRRDAMGPGVIWENIWVGDMDPIIPLSHTGVDFEILDIGIDGVEFAPLVDCECDLTEFLYPLCSLEKVQ